MPKPLTDPKGFNSKSSANKVIGVAGYTKLIGVPEPTQIEAAVGVVVPEGGGVFTTCIVKESNRLQPAKGPPPKVVPTT